MENVQATEGQATEGTADASVQEGSQPQQEGQAQQVEKPEETQAQAKAEEMVSRMEYNKARESERKLKSELAKISKVLDGSRQGITLYDTLSKSSPEKLKQIIDLLQNEAAPQQEDDSWLNEFDARIANKFREQSKMKNFVERDLLSRINQLEQQISASQNWTIEQNKNNLEGVFENFLKQNKIFEEVNEEIAKTPKFQMIQSFVLNKLSEKYKDPRSASVEDFQEVLNDVKAGWSEIGKQETYKKVQSTVPMSGSRAGQIPKSDKVSSEDVTNLWKSFRQEAGW